VSEVRGEPAGFWRRYAAWSLDWMLLGAVLAFALVPLLLRAWSQLQALEQELQDAMYERLMSAGGALASPLALATKLLADPAIANTIRAGSAQISLSLLQAALIAFGASALYFAASEGSAWQATPGKRLLGLRVRDLRGEPVGFGRALMRHLAGAIRWLTFNLGPANHGRPRDPGDACFSSDFRSRRRRRPPLFPGATDDSSCWRRLSRHSPASSQRRQQRQC